jgi:hypothetical protein
MRFPARDRARHLPAAAIARSGQRDTHPPIAQPSAALERMAQGLSVQSVAGPATALVGS